MALPLLDFGLAFLNRHVVPQVKSPYFSYSYAGDGTRFQAVDAPSQPAELADLIDDAPQAARTSG